MILGGKRQQTFSISGADHHTVCKFRSADDAQYLQVAGALEDLASQALDRRQQRLAPAKALTPAMASSPASSTYLSLHTCLSDIKMCIKFWYLLQCLFC